MDIIHRLAKQYAVPFKTDPCKRKRSNYQYNYYFCVSDLSRFQILSSNEKLQFAFVLRAVTYINLKRHICVVTKCTSGISSTSKTFASLDWTRCMEAFDVGSNVWPVISIHGSPVMKTIGQ